MDFFFFFLQIPAQPGRDAKMIHSIASLIRAKSKLLLLENPDTVEIYKVSSIQLFEQHCVIIITTMSDVLTSRQADNLIFNTEEFLRVWDSVFLLHLFTCGIIYVKLHRYLQYQKVISIWT